MVKHVFDRSKTFVPAALVVAGWCFYICGVIADGLLMKLAFLAAARVLP